MANGDDRRGLADLNCDSVTEKLMRELRDRCLRYDNTVDGTRLNADLALLAGAMLMLLKAAKT
jgi:hypothetical protein